MRDKLKFYRLSDAAFYDCIDTIYQFIKSFLDKKCLFLRDMEPLIKEDIKSTTVPIVSYAYLIDLQDFCFVS